MSLKTYLFDAARYLDNDESIAGFMEAAFESGDAAEITHDLGIVARAHGMTRIAKDAGLSRESLYRALGENGEPEFATVLKVAKALRLRLGVVSAAAE